MLIYKCFSDGIQQIKNKKGESIAETLVALLIAALGILLLASMIMSSSNIISRSKTAIDEYVNAENKLVSDMANRTDAKGKGSITMKTQTGQVKLSEIDSSGKVDYYVNEKADNVIAYMKSSGGTN